MIFMTSCAPTNSITADIKSNLMNWRAESENVMNLSILVEDPGVEGSPVLLSDEMLIFESKKSTNYDLWAINPNKKGGIRQLTNSEGEDRHPCPHPDGKRYVFLSDRSETGYYMGEVGKSTVISLVESHEPYFGGWTRGDISPDGKTFLYVDGKYIWSLDLETRVKMQLIQGSAPRWSPDGSKIIYRKIAREIGSNMISASVWTMNPDASEQTEIISGTDQFSYGGASFSPDGSRILYEKRMVVVKGEAVNYYNSDLWVCNADGSKHINITTNPLVDGEAYWIDDATIVFVSNRPQSGNYDDRTWDIWRANLEF